MIEFNLSMDFELGWGDLQRVTQDEAFYRRVVDGLACTGDVIETLRRNALPSTWGIVGACGCNSLEQLRAAAPEAFNVVQGQLAALSQRRPAYEEVLFCPSVVQRIAGCESIELGSHGFLHLTPGGVPVPVLRDDVCASTRMLGSVSGKPVTSFIPPQNYFWPDDAFAGSGIRYIRHTPWVLGFSYSDPGVPAKFARLWNDFVWPVAESDAHGNQARLLFLRIDRGASLWDAQLRQIRHLLAGAQGSLHCFSHPHNLDTPAIVRRLAQLCELVGEARDRGRLRFGHFFRELGDAGPA
jgi:peptidoglycan/xylan/chitin deacetylase (PgdA/CDA1 family)